MISATTMSPARTRSHSILSGSALMRSRTRSRPRSRRRARLRARTQEDGNVGRASRRRTRSRRRWRTTGQDKQCLHRVAISRRVGVGVVQRPGQRRERHERHGEQLGPSPHPQGGKAGHGKEPDCGEKRRQDANDALHREAVLDRFGHWLLGRTPRPVAEEVAPVIGVEDRPEGGRKFPRCGPVITSGRPGST